LRVAVELAGAGAARGDSIAVNGCCLTIVEIAENGRILGFDLLRETWNRTNLSTARIVNLERSLRADGRIHGHFVTGHIDGTGRIETFEPRGADWYLSIAPPPEMLRYLVFKGAIAVDGISLTLAEVTDRTFAVWIIPHTYAVTALRERRAGALVNLEADLLAKYIEKLRM
jgi:riboflavin synthase